MRAHRARLLLQAASGDTRCNRSRPTAVRSLRFLRRSPACMSVETSRPVSAATTASGRVKVANPAGEHHDVSTNHSSPSSPSPSLLRPRATRRRLGLACPPRTSPAPPNRHDDEVCGVNTLRGTYVFAASGLQHRRWGRATEGDRRGRRVQRRRHAVGSRRDGQREWRDRPHVEWGRDLYGRGRLLGNHPLRRSDLRHLRVAGCRDDLDDPDQSEHRLPRDGDTDIARPRPALTRWPTTR